MALSKAEQKLIQKEIKDKVAKEKEARKKLEKKLVERIVKNEEANDPGKKYRAIPLVNLDKRDFPTFYLPTITGDKPFKYSVLVPLSNMSGTYNAKQLYKSFEKLINRTKVIEGKNITPRATARELKAFKKKLEDIRWELHQLPIGVELDELEQELVFAPNTIDKLIKNRQSKMKSSKYPDEIVKVTAHLVEYWCAVTGSKTINAYSRGNRYDNAGVRDDVANQNLKTIDVKYNPGGSFIQRVLKTYFRLTLDNIQLKTLLNKVKSKK